MNRFRDECKFRGIDYDGSELVQVSPGVYMFYETPLSQECRKSGHCRYTRHYAIVMGDRIMIQHTI